MDSTMNIPLELLTGIILLTMAFFLGQWAAGLTPLDGRMKDAFATFAAIFVGMIALLVLSTYPLIAALIDGFQELVTNVSTAVFNSAWPGWLVQFLGAILLGAWYHIKTKWWTLLIAATAMLVAADNIPILLTATEKGFDIFVTISNEIVKFALAILEYHP